MQENGIRADQVSQVRGFADQRLRQPDSPLDPSNRRISLIVQYILKNGDSAEENTEQKPATRQNNEATGEHAPAASTEKAAEKSEH